MFERGFVTYSNEAKEEMLGVDPALIAAHGAVSREVAIAMAACALRQSRAAALRRRHRHRRARRGERGETRGARPFRRREGGLAARRRTSNCRALHQEERFGDIGRAEVRAKSVETALRLLLRAAALD